MWAAILLLSPAVYSASPGESFIEALKSNVVQITTSREDGWEENGSGFIIGEGHNRVLIVTANHVVRGEQGPEPLKTDVTVRYFSDQGKGYNATVLETNDAKLDLAIIQVPRPDGALNWKRESLSAERVVARTPVWFIGRQGKWYMPSTPGSVNRYDDNLESILNIYVDGLDVLTGTSGAPLISEGGIIGMLIDDKPGRNAQALPIDTIQRKVKAWGYPWQLTAYAAVRSFYIEHDPNSKHIAEYLRKQMIEEGLNVSNNRDKKGYNTITISIKSKIKKTSVFGSKIAKLSTDIVIKDRSKKVVFRESFLTNGSSDDDANDAVDDASYILVSQLGDERVIYDVFEQIK